MLIPYQNIAQVYAATIENERQNRIWREFYNGKVKEQAPLESVTAKASNCRNCGAPHEPVCSYCGSKS